MKINQKLQNFSKKYNFSFIKKYFFLFFALFLIIGGIVIALIIPEKRILFTDTEGLLGLLFLWGFCFFSIWSYQLFYYKKGCLFFSLVGILGIILWVLFLSLALLEVIYINFFEPGGFLEITRTSLFIMLFTLLHIFLTFLSLILLINSDSKFKKNIKIISLVILVLFFVFFSIFSILLYNQ